MIDNRPGLSFHRLATISRQIVGRCRLDLFGSVVLTEAATGAYVVTPVIAAMAGAKRVYAYTRSSVYGSVEEVSVATFELAALTGVHERIEVITDKSQDVVGRADIITNSGHLRPVDAKMVSWMKTTAVIPLMYEAWEFRPDDVDLVACRRRGIAVAGTNERNSRINVLSYLGIMGVKLLLDAGMAVHGNRVLTVCDNHFAPYLERGLKAAGAIVDTATTFSDAYGQGCFDAVVVALQPSNVPVLGKMEAAEIAARWPGVVIVQFWGDIDRSELADKGLTFWPIDPPAPGHMGILPSAVGPDPVIRLQAGGLKVGEILWRARQKGVSARVAERQAESLGWSNLVSL